MIISDICEYGQYWDKSNDTCKPCPIGTYQDQLYKYTCTPCPANTTTKTVGAVNESFCECKFPTMTS